LHAVAFDLVEAGEGGDGVGAALDGGEDGLVELVEIREIALNWGFLGLRALGFSSWEVFLALVALGALLDCLAFLRGGLASADSSLARPGSTAMPFGQLAPVLSSCTSRTSLVSVSRR
jgi:hypothetical protein